MNATVTAEITDTIVTVGGASAMWTGRVVKIGGYTFIRDGKGQCHELCERCDSRVAEDGTITRTGFIRHFSHVADGVCFGCYGVGVARKAIPSVDDAVKRVKARIAGKASRERKAQREAAEKAQRAAQWREENPDLAAFVAEVLADEWTDVESGPVREFCWTINRGDTLSERQASYFAKIREIMIERKAKRAARAAEIATYAYVGEIGQKITESGTIITAFTTEPNDYGKSSRIVVVDTGSAFVKMTTTALWAWDVEKGEKITVTGTIKAHKEWNGMPQTILLRPKRA